MSDANPITPAAYCRTCGKPLFENVQRTETGAAYCEEHFPAPAYATPPPPPPPPGAPGTYGESAYSGASSSFAGAGASGFAAGNAAPMPGRFPAGALSASGSPALAFFLGFIPGVGAIYNAQYAKGLIHAVTFGLLVSLASSDASRGIEPLVGMLIAVFVFYMAFEAYHTARKRRDAEPVDEFSSLIGMGTSRVPTAGIALIALGLLLLLLTNDLISMYMFRRAWPAGLVLVGGYMLYARMKGAGNQ